MEWCIPENDDFDESGSALNTDDLQKVRNNTILSIFCQIIRFIFIISVAKGDKKWDTALSSSAIEKVS